jgi:hypothetical protein
MELNGSSGTPALDEGQFDGSVADNGVGDYTITMNEAFLRIPQVYPSARTAGIHVRCVATLSTIQVLCFSDLAETTPAEADVDLLIHGADSQDEI